VIAERHARFLQPPFYRLFAVVPARHEGDWRVLAHLTNRYHVLGRLHVDAGRPEQALEPYHKALATHERLLRIKPEGSMRFSACAGTWHRLGEALMLRGRRSEAVDTCRQSLACLRRISPHELGAAEYRRLWAVQSDKLFQVLIGVDQLDEAIAVARERLDRWPDDPQVSLDVAAGLASSAVLAGRGHPVVAVVLSGRLPASHRPGGADVLAGTLPDGSRQPGRSQAIPPRGS
jgi:tetratricopeptide (TPR) repeat protein